MVKISEYPTLTTLDEADLFDTSFYDSATVSYISKAVSWGNIIISIGDDLKLLDGPLGVGATAPLEASAVLQVDSITQGLLPPRVTSVQKAAIAAPASGLLVYDTTMRELQIYNSAAWVSPYVPAVKTFGTLVDAATIVWDYTDGYNAQVTLGGNRILGTPSSVVNGDYGTLKIIQDVTGGRTLTLPATFKVVNAGAGAITLTAAANAVDILTWTYDGTDFWVTLGLNFT